MSKTSHASPTTTTFEKAFTEGEQLRSQWNKESLEASIRKYEEASHFAKLKKDLQGVILAIKAISEVYVILGKNDQAAKQCRRALAINKRLGDQKLEVDLLNRLGEAEIDKTGGPQKSAESFNKARVISEQLKYDAGLARSLNNLGLVEYIKSREKEALEYWGRALSLRRSIGDRQGEAETVTNLGYISTESGELGKALEQFTEAAALAKSVGDQRQEAITQNLIGLMHTARGEMEEARSSYRTATETLRRIGDRISEASGLNGLGYLSEELGDAEGAADSFSKALAIWSEAGQRSRAARSLRLLGRVHSSVGNYATSLKYYRSALRINRLEKSAREQAYSQIDIGSVYDVLGKHGQALRCYQTALTLCKSENHPRLRAFALNSLGSAYHRRRDFKKARKFYQQASEMIGASGDRRGEALVLHNIVRLKRDMNDLDGALNDAKRLISMVESQRDTVNSLDMQASYFASVYSHYELYIDLLMLMHQKDPAGGYDVQAFEQCEQRRGRGMTETLLEARLNIREGADAKLLEQEQNLQYQLKKKAERHMDLLQDDYDLKQTMRAAKSDKKRQEIRERQLRTQAQIAENEEESAELTRKLDETGSVIRSGSPKYADLKKPLPLSLDQIQREVLDQDTQLLTFLVGDERSFLWVVSPTSFNSFVLPGRAQIEKQLRDLYGVVSHDPRERRPKRTKPIDYAEAGRRMSEMVLGPAAAQLRSKRLVIIRDGALQYLPFKMLRIPGEDDMLLARHEIMTLPSLAALVELRKTAASRKPAAKTAAVFADPVVEDGDPRLNGLRPVKPSTKPERRTRGGLRFDLESLPNPRSLLGESISINQNVNLGRLQFSRDEADAIADMVGRESSWIAVGLDATKTAIQERDLSEFRILHFATHSIVNLQRPQWSCVVLSKFNNRGEPEEPFLLLNDIYNMKLNADVVVLSACQTALGKEIRGEGLASLTRGFMYAGASRVVASLWKVDDEASANLMGLFYKKMISDHLSPAAALNEAQNELRRQPHWSHPFYWSAFEIQGEW